EKIVSKPFDKEDELAQLKKDVFRLEREITVKIRENQMKQQEKIEKTIDAPVIQMEPDNKKEKSLLPKKQANEGKAKGLRV
ncbi:hypothetical protein ABTN23_19385, partial [Acinetobacter baumannii]